MPRRGRKKGSKIGAYGTRDNSGVRMVLKACIALRGGNLYQILNWIGKKFDEYPSENSLKVVTWTMVKRGLLSHEPTICNCCGKIMAIYTATDEGRLSI